MKWESPIFDKITGSLKATETTFRVWKERKIAEIKPIPRQVYSHLQLYQRSLYKSALESWKQLTPEQKEFWKAEAEKLALDGHNLYIHKYITQFGKPVSAWLCSTVQGNILPDYYGLNDMTIYGATSGSIDNWKFLTFDGVDDYAIKTNPQNIPNTNELTIILFIRPKNQANTAPWRDYFMIYKDGNNRITLEPPTHTQYLIWFISLGGSNYYGANIPVVWEKFNMLAGIFSTERNYRRDWLNGRLISTRTPYYGFSGIQYIALHYPERTGVFSDIAEVRIYPRPLSLQELNAIWQVYQKSPLFKQ